MFKVLSGVASLSKTPLSRSLPAFSTCSFRFSSSLNDPTSKNEAPKIENEAVLALPQEARDKNALESTIIVPSKESPASKLKENVSPNSSIIENSPNREFTSTNLYNTNQIEVELAANIMMENLETNSSVIGISSNIRTASTYQIEIVDLSPITGVPEEHVVNRRVRIYQPPKNAMQSGTNNIHHWEMEFDNRQRWENPLMGWTSTGDPLSNMKIQFSSPDEAIDHCEKNGWAWYLDEPKIEKAYRPKNYGVNFAWNRRTRVSTK